MEYEEDSDDPAESDDVDDDVKDDKSLLQPSTNSSILTKLRADPPPDPLPEGWIMHRSRSQRGYVYYFEACTGQVQWEAPFATQQPPTDIDDGVASSKLGISDQLNSLIGLHPSNGDSVKSILKRSRPSVKIEAGTPAPTDKNHATDTTIVASPKTKKHRHIKSDTPDNNNNNSTPTKGRRPSSSSSPTTAPSSSLPLQVRVLHILKKHKKSRRPASWRNPSITISRADAVVELEEVRSILEETKDDPKELRATFEELARTESDCSSARKGGDLGYFACGKMQPNFEKASFGLRVGELSGIVDTSSGVHVLLRLG